ncbi:hypothetical protein A1354_28960 [Pseudomonas asplenii]|nr:hypothetical protein A1354_28960 [Pseudomonas asplenii]
MSPSIQIASKSCLAIFRPMIYLNFGIGPESALGTEPIQLRKWAHLPSGLHHMVAQILLVYLTYTSVRSPKPQPQKFVRILGKLLV